MPLRRWHGGLDLPNEPELIEERDWAEGMSGVGKSTVLDSPHFTEGDTEALRFHQLPPSLRPLPWPCQGYREQILK